MKGNKTSADNIANRILASFPEKIDRAVGVNFFSFSKPQVCLMHMYTLSNGNYCFHLTCTSPYRAPASSHLTTLMNPKHLRVVFMKTWKKDIFCIWFGLLITRHCLTGRNGNPLSSVDWEGWSQMVLRITRDLDTHGLRREAWPALFVQGML